VGWLEELELLAECNISILALTTNLIPTADVLENWWSLGSCSNQLGTFAWFLRRIQARFCVAYIHVSCVCAMLASKKKGTPERCMHLFFYFLKLRCMHLGEGKMDRICKWCADRGHTRGSKDMNGKWQREILFWCILLKKRGDKGWVCFNSQGLEGAPCDHVHTSCAVYHFSSETRMILYSNSCCCYTWRIPFPVRKQL
jgi:hypothetical protein